MRDPASLTGPVTPAVAQSQRRERGRFLAQVVKKNREFLRTSQFRSVRGPTSRMRIRISFPGPRPSAASEDKTPHASDDPTRSAALTRPVPIHRNSGTRLFRCPGKDGADQAPQPPVRKKNPPETLTVSCRRGSAVSRSHKQVGQSTSGGVPLRKAFLFSHRKAANRSPREERHTQRLLIS